MRLATFAFRDHPDDEKTDDEMKTFKEKNDILEFLESITLKMNFYFETSWKRFQIGQITFKNQRKQ